MKKTIAATLLALTSLTGFASENPNVYLAQELDSQTTLSNGKSAGYCITKAYASVADRSLSSKTRSGSSYTCTINFNAVTENNESITGARTVDYEVQVYQKSSNDLGQKMRDHFGFFRLDMGTAVLYSPIADVVTGGIYNTFSFLSDIFTKDIFEQQIDAQPDMLEMRQAQMAACQVAMLELIPTACEENQETIATVVSNTLEMMKTNAELYNKMIPAKK